MAFMHGGACASRHVRLLQYAKNRAHFYPVPFRLFFLPEALTPPGLCLSYIIKRLIDAALVDTVRDSLQAVHIVDVAFQTVLDAPFIGYAACLALF